MIRNRLIVVAGFVAFMAPASTALAADHMDSPTVKADATADINDLYSFVDGGDLVVAMTVFPSAAAGSKFSDKVQYIFHTTSGSAFNDLSSTLDVVCTFNVAQTITCLIGEGPGQPALDRATGDASSVAGLPSEGGILTVYAGLRKDPFFFNLEGFNTTVEVVKSAAASLSFDGAGCPFIDASTSSLLVNQLKSNSNGGSPTISSSP